MSLFKKLSLAQLLVASAALATHQKTIEQQIKNNNVGGGNVDPRVAAERMVGLGNDYKTVSDLYVQVGTEINVKQIAAKEREANKLAKKNKTPATTTVVTPAPKA
jgi:hypothetical protein